MLSFLKSIFRKKQKPAPTRPKGSSFENSNLTKSVDINIGNISNYFGNSFDLKHRKFKLAESNTFVSVIFIDVLADQSTIQEHVIEPLITNKIDSKIKIGIREIKDYILSGKHVREVSSINEIVSGILSGETFLCLDGCDTGLLIDTVKLKGRAIDEAAREPSVMGSQEAFYRNIER